MRLTALTTKPIRILHVTGMAHGGAGQHVLSLATGCNPSRFDVTVAMATESPMREQFEQAGVRIKPLCLNHFGGVLKNLVGLGQLVQLLRSGDFDIVHTHTSVAGAVGRVAARLASRVGRCTWSTRLPRTIGVRGRCARWLSWSNVAWIA